MKPIRITYDPEADAIAIEFPGWGPGASVRMRHLDCNRFLDFDRSGRLISIELLNVSHGVELDGLPEVEVVRGALELLGLGQGAAA